MNFRLTLDTLRGKTPMIEAPIVGSAQGRR
jgi:hypothetical protein